MQLQYLTSVLLTAAYVSAAGIDIEVRNNANVARNPACHLVSRHDSPNHEKQWSPVPRPTTQKWSPVPHPTSKKTTLTTYQRTTTSKEKTTKKTTKPTTKPTQKPTKTTTKATTTSSAACRTESQQCDPTGTAFPPCCAGQCLQGFNAYFCRTNCLPDGSPCTLDDPGVCCGQICLVDGYCVTI